MYVLFVHACYVRVCVCICLGMSGSSHINEVILEALGNTIVYHNLKKDIQMYVYIGEKSNFQALQTPSVLWRYFLQQP